MITFFDTETTGLVKWDVEDTHPDQPRMVSLGLVLTDDDGREIFSLGCIIKPEGFEIPEKAASIHGITTEMANHFGLPSKMVLGFFLMCASQSHTCVAHNYKFDRTILNRELFLMTQKINQEYSPLPDSKSFCTMLAIMNVCRIPGTSKGRGFKWPKLEEAYRFLFNREMEGAHNAMCDVRATKEIFFEGVRQGHFELKNVEEFVK
jgi:DNA polymerase-3 subunit epsilon